MTAVTYVDSAGSKNLSRSDASCIKPYDESESAIVCGIGLTKLSSNALSRGTSLRQPHS